MITGAICRITFSGTIENLETFAHRMHMQVDTPADLPDALLAADGWLNSFLAASAVTSLGGGATIATAFHTGVHWTKIHAAYIDHITGKQTGPGQEMTVSHAGTGTGISLPFQCSHCITILAGSTPGLKRNRNRFYLPPYTTVTMAANLSKYQPTFVTDVANAYKTAVDNYQTVHPFPVLAYSQANGGALVATETYIGDVIDTQRRRRRSLIEARTVVAFP